jgi:TorA maturation chaperone TorD
MLHDNERKNIYALLANIFTYPDAKLIEEMEKMPEESLPFGVDRKKLVVSPEALEEVQVAYTSLFINRLGGIPTPLYGSAYLDAEGKLLSTSTLEVAEFYKLNGLELTDDVEPPDYLPTELEFMHYLIELTQEKKGSGNNEEEMAAKTLQAHFFMKFMAPWLSIFTSKLLSQPDLPSLYLNAGLLLEGLCAKEAEAFPIATS